MIRKDRRQRDRAVMVPRPLWHGAGDPSAYRRGGPLEVRKEGDEEKRWRFVVRMSSASAILVDASRCLRSPPDRNARAGQPRHPPPRLRASAPRRAGGRNACASPSIFARVRRPSAPFPPSPLPLPLAVVLPVIIGFLYSLATDPAVPQLLRVTCERAPAPARVRLLVWCPIMWTPHPRPIAPPAPPPPRLSPCSDARPPRARRALFALSARLTLRSPRRVGSGRDAPLGDCSRPSARWTRALRGGGRTTAR